MFRQGLKGRVWGEKYAESQEKSVFQVNGPGTKRKKVNRPPRQTRKKRSRKIKETARGGRGATKNLNVIRKHFF